MNFSIGYGGYSPSEAGFVYEQAAHAKAYEYTPVKSSAEDKLASDSISLFPSFFAKQHCDDAKKRVLASIDSKDQYCIAPMLNKAQVLALIKKLKGELTKLHDPVVDELLTGLFKSIHVLTGPSLSFNQWANLSLRLEALLALLKRHSNDALPALAYIKIIVVKLEYVCRYTWKQQAYEQLIQIFTQQFVQLIVTNPVANYVRSAKGTLEVGTPLDILSASGSVGGEVSFRFDDEGYGKTTRISTGDFGLNLKLPFMKINGKIAGTKGDYNYCRTARHHAICYFEEIIRNNRDSIRISQFLSRRKTLGMTDDANEMEEFYAAQKDYLLQSKSTASAFSLFLSLDYLGNTLGLSAAGELISSDQLKTTQSQAPLPGKITPNAQPHYKKEKKKAVVVGGTTETTTGSLSGKLGFDIQVYEASATLSGEWSKKVSKNTRYTTAIDLLDNKYANSNKTFEKKLKRDVRASGAAIKEKMRKHWYPKPASKFVYDATTCEMLALEYQRAPGDFAKNNLIRLVQEPAFNRMAPQALVGLVQDFAKNPNQYTQRDVASLMCIPNIDQILAPGFGVPTDVDRLMQDLEFLENLHAQQAMGDATVGASIAQFYKMYGAKNGEECLRDMALLTAYCYEQLSDKKSALAIRLKELETRIYATGIPHRPDVLRKLAGASQNYYAITSEKTVQFVLKNRFKLPFVHITAPGLGFKATISDLKHYNPSRSGKSYNFEITLSGDLGLDQEILDALVKLLKYEGASAMANYFETPDLAGKFGKGTFVMKYFLPEDAGQMQTVQLYQRIITQTGFEITPELPFAFPGIANITLSATYAGSNTTLALDKPTPETMILFILHYLHAMFTETIQLDKSDPTNLKEVQNEDSQASYWHVLLEHQATLKQLFLNIADGKLANEFEHLAHRYLAHASGEERDRVAKAQEDLLMSAVKYRTRHAKGDYKGDYQATLENFKTYMRSLYDQWIWTRELSDVYEPYQYGFNVFLN